MAVVKEKVCRRESQRSCFQASLKKDGDETVSSAASAAYLNQSLHLTANSSAVFGMLYPASKQVVFQASLPRSVGGQVK